MKHREAWTLNINEAVDAAGREAKALACECWPDLRPTTAEHRLLWMRKGQRLTPENLAALAAGLGIKVEELTRSRPADGDQT